VLNRFAFCCRFDWKRRAAKCRMKIWLIILHILYSNMASRNAMSLHFRSCMSSVPASQYPARQSLCGHQTVNWRPIMCTQLICVNARRSLLSRRAENRLKSRDMACSGRRLRPWGAANPISGVTRGGAEEQVPPPRAQRAWERKAASAKHLTIAKVSMIDLNLKVRAST